jgi:aminotransferase
MLSISKRATRIAQAEIRAMTIECEKVGGINLAQGVCDTAVPPVVRKGAQYAIDAGINSYTRFNGLTELRLAIARKLRTYNHIDADPETEITVSAGTTGSFYCACLALLNPGDEVIVFEPYYGYHVNTLWAAEAIPVYVTMRTPDWTFTPEDLEKVVTPRTRAILINTPANPSGKVFSRTELEWVAEFADRHDVFVFTDEIYEYIVYEGRKHISPGSLSSMKERTITISGYSKTFSVTGWRIGYSVAAPRWARMIGYLNDLIYVCAPAPLQYGVAQGIEELTREYYERSLAEYTAKRELLCSALCAAGLRPYIPEGAYYVLANVSTLPGQNSKEKAMYLLHETGVATVPGEAFYHGTEGDNLLRLCFAKTEGELKDACERLMRLKAAAVVPSMQ